MPSQIEITEKIKSLVSDISHPINPGKLIEIKDRLYSKLEIRPYNDQTKEHEKAIRWRRTAGQILNDGYVYEGKACTDIVVLFLALCCALDLETRFVKIKKEKMVHSVAEVKLDDGWYIFDVSCDNCKPKKGEIKGEGGWQLWKKGRDAWDLGLTDYDSIEKIV